MRRLALAAVLVASTLAGQALAADPTITWSPFASSDAKADFAADHGKVVFNEACAACHGTIAGAPGTEGLQAKYHGNPPALLEQRTDLTQDQVKYFVRHGVATMPYFRKTELSDPDLNALAAYLSRNTKG